MEPRIREKKGQEMKKLLGLVLMTILLFGLSGCATCTGLCETIKQEWVEYWESPRSRSWDLMTQEWFEYWN
jgi:hypothetical protein